jgi:hypothetical protein
MLLKMPDLGEIMAGLTAGLIREFTSDHGPVKRCRRCGRVHPARASCGLVEVLVPAKSGRMVKRWVQPPRD